MLELALTVEGPRFEHETYASTTPTDLSFTQKKKNEKKKKRLRGSREISLRLEMVPHLLSSLELEKSRLV